MKLLRLSPIFLLIFLTSCDGLFPFMNSDVKKKNLYGEWHMEKYKVDGKMYYAEPGERETMLELKNNGSFVCIEDGETIQGDWDYYPMFNTVSLMENGEWDCIEYQVQEVNEESLIYTYRPYGGNAMKVWMTPEPRTSEANE